MDKTTALRIARKEIRREYGAHPLFSFCYCEGSRTVGGFLESIRVYTLMGDAQEAEFWANELRALVPQFTERV